MENTHTTYFRGPVRLLGGDSRISHFELADGSARIAVENNTHVRLIKKLMPPPVFEIVAPFILVDVESGSIPQSYQTQQPRSYYDELEDYYVPLMMQDMERIKAKGAQGGCSSAVITLCAIPCAIWFLSQSL